MREIKFRAWHKKSRQIFDVIQMDESGASQLGGKGRTENICIQCREQPCYSPHVFGNDCELMQYTGLHDKNGKEIYEGDILQVDYSKRVIEVVWRKGSWVANYQGEYLCPLMGVPGFAGYESKEIEVIGNIYENPELLEVSK